jgi:hypothetical protein
MLLSMKPKAVGSNPNHNRRQMLDAVKVDDDCAYMVAFPAWQWLHDEIKAEWEHFCFRIQKVRKF